MTVSREISKLVCDLESELSSLRVENERLKNLLGQDKLKIHSEEEVMQVLWKRIKATSMRKVAKEFKFSTGWISLVANGERGMSEEFAAKLGFTKLPNSYLPK